jgi:hypothetical protein
LLGRDEKAFTHLLLGKDENAFAHPLLLGKDENAFSHPLLGKDENAFTNQTTFSPSKAMELTWTENVIKPWF